MLGIILYVNGKTADTIYYTVDGTVPSVNSLEYRTPVRITESPTTIKAFAVFTDGTVGVVSEATYTLAPRLPAIDFRPPNGANTPTSVTLEVPGHSGAEIWYTTDGTIPSATHGNLYSSPIDLSTTTTIKAIGYETGWTPTPVGVASYAPPDYSFGQLPAVTYQPGSGAAQPFPVLVTLTCPGHPAATILYTVDGSTPNYSSAVYAGAAVSAPTGVVKAFALELHYAPSVVSSVTYTQAAANVPILTPGGGAVPLHSTVSIQISQTGVTVYYTLDGTDPVLP